MRQNLKSAFPPILRGSSAIEQGNRHRNPIAGLLNRRGRDGLSHPLFSASFEPDSISIP